MVEQAKENQLSTTRRANAALDKDLQGNLT